MLRLHGFPTSNYHNVVKLALLEKGISFEEVLVYPPADDAHRAHNPTGKFPCLETRDGTFLGETKVILNYLEDAYPDVPLLPASPLERAQVRELMEIIDLHLELPARRLYPEALFGGEVSDEVKTKAEEMLRRGAAGLRARARFAPYVAGSQLSLADFGATMHLPIVSHVTRTIYGDDFLAGIEGLEAHRELMRARESVQAVRRAARDDQPEFLKRMAGGPAPAA